MEGALASDVPPGRGVGVIMADLQVFVSRIQRPRLGDESWAQSMRLRGEELARRVSVIRESMAGRQRACARSFDKVAEALRDYSRELECTPRGRKLHALYVTLSRYYEELIVHLQELKMDGELSAARVGHLKPINYARNAIHAALGLYAVLMYEFVITHRQAVTILLVLVAVFGFFEFVRRYVPRLNDFLIHGVLGIFSRPSERHHAIGSTYYILSMTFITLIFPRHAIEAAVLILAFADPAATIAGKLWGRRKLYRVKSCVGTAAFFAVSAAVSLVFLLLAAPQMPAVRAVLASLILASAGAGAELLSGKIDDNFTIPIAVAAAGYLIL